MHRQDLLRALERYRAENPGEMETIDRVCRFVAEQPGCFERSLAMGHVTGSAWLVDQAGARVLLTHHRKLGQWLQLGGHADGDSNVLNVALREALEESGLTVIEPVSEAIFDVDIHQIPQRGTEPAHLHHDVRYALRARKNEHFVVSDESNALAWMDIARIADISDEPTMLRMAGKWLARGGHAS